MFSYFRPPTFGDPGRDERGRVLFFSILLITTGCIIAWAGGIRTPPSSFDPRLLPLA